MRSLQNDLKRAGITPYAWVINQCLPAVDGLKDLKKSRIREINIINIVKERLSAKTFEIPYLPEENLLPALLTRFGDQKVIECWSAYIRFYQEQP